MNAAATADKVLEALHRNMRTSPPPGIATEYIDGFFARNSEALLWALRARLETHAALTRSSAAPTAWGGQRGLTTLAPHQIEAGRRVVVLNTLLEWVHGTIVESSGGGRRVRLDSGASSWFPSLWPEVAPPPEAPRDITVGMIDGQDYGVLQPFDLWKRIRGLVLRLTHDSQLHSGGGGGSRRTAVALWRLFCDWLTARGRRPLWLSWSGRELRLLELLSSDIELADGAAEKLELNWLLQLPERYYGRFLPGDKVRSVRFDGEGETQRTAEISIERMTTAGVVYRRELHPYHYLEPISTEPGMNTCLPPFEEPVRPIELFDLLKDGSEWVELSPAQLHAWIDHYLHEHRVEAHVQLLSESGGRIRIEPIDSRYDARYLPLDVLNQVFLYLPKVVDDGIEIDLFQVEDAFDGTLPHLRRPVQVHPTFVPSLARALITTALEHDLSLNPAIRRCLPTPGAPGGEATASGGRSGAPVVYSPLHKMNSGYRGMRVVTPDGQHGRIAWSTQRPEKGTMPVEIFRVRLDSGREEDHEQVYLETARPRLIVPDVRIDGRYVAPREVWEKVSLNHFRLMDEVQSDRRRVKREVREARETLRVWYPAWHSWRRANPEAVVSGFDAQADVRIATIAQELLQTADSREDGNQTDGSSSSR